MRRDPMEDWKVNFPYKELPGFQSIHRPEPSRLLPEFCQCSRKVSDSSIHQGPPWNATNPDDVQEALKRGRAR